jgi:chemosensory pili system protein ChpA (sensor histidine kinase/response regulator)
MLTRLDALDATVLGQDALLAGVQDVNDDTQLSSELVDPGVDSSFFSASGSTLEPIVGFESSPQAKPKAQTEEMEDRLDSQDELDYDLLPVFQEEAVELLPALGLALRQWVAHLGDVALRANILRLLHTLKGSGRLIGAFQLGELAHRMESEIEQLPSHDLSRMHLEPLLARFDRLQALFEVLGEDRKENLGPTSVDPSIQNDTAQHDHALMSSGASPQALRPLAGMASGLIRVRTSLVERLVDGVGEVSVYRSHAETHLAQMGNALGDLNLTLDRLATQLRELELQADMHIQSRNIMGSDAMQQFDPLEFDRFTRLQEIARMMTEAVGDVSTVRRNVLNALSASQHDLEQQSRQLRQLQRDLLRMRLVEFEVIADRLYSVVRLAAKELGKQVVLELQGGKIDLDRSVLERMTPSFEHLLRNAVAHGIESTDERSAAGKSAVGAIKVVVNQEGNDVAIQVSDDGRGFSLKRIREKAMALGLIAPGEELDREATIKILFTQGFSTVGQVTELAGRGIGLDVVLSEVRALGGRIETHSEEGVGTTFKLVFPLTTAVTQVLIFRVGEACFGIPVGLVQAVTRASPNKIKVAYEEGEIITEQGQAILFYGSGPLLQIKQGEVGIEATSLPLLILRSAGQGLALHVDEVLGNREVVVKNMGPQLSRLPGLAGIAILPRGEPILIYNPIALANVYGNEVRKAQTVDHLAAGTATAPVKVQAPLILVVDDALTVRRVIERLLLREGYRVALANDGVHALQVLEQQRPLVVLSDIEMPRMDGFELARSIRSRPEYADLPIVMITSRIAQKHRDHAMSLGVNHYLGKPYSESELLGLIRDQVQATGNAAVLHQALNV